MFDFLLFSHLAEVFIQSTLLYGMFYFNYWSIILVQVIAKASSGVSDSRDLCV